MTTIDETSTHTATWLRAAEAAERATDAYLPGPDMEPAS